MGNTNGKAAETPAGETVDLPGVVDSEWSSVAERIRSGGSTHNVWQLVVRISKERELQSFVEKVVKFEALQSLQISLLGECQTVSAVKRIAEILPECPELLDLNLSGYGIGTEEISALTALLLKCLKLQALHLSGNLLTAAGISVLAEILPKCLALRVLNLENNRIGSEGLSALVNSLTKCLTLQVLGLNGNDIGTEGISALANVLPQCLALRFLSLSDNSIGLDAISMLANSLPQCTKLKHLSLYSVSMGAEGVSVLTKFLPECTVLELLEIGGREFTSTFTVSLLKSLKLCKSLRYLSLLDTAFDSTAEEQFRRFGVENGVSVLVTAPNTTSENRKRDKETAKRWNAEFRKKYNGEWKRDIPQRPVNTERTGAFDSATGRKAFAAILSAAQKQNGAIRICRGRFVLFGDSEVGKTWTMNSMLNIRNVKSERTRGADTTMVEIEKVLMSGGDVDKGVNLSVDGEGDSGSESGESATGGIALGSTEGLVMPEVEHTSRSAQRDTIDPSAFDDNKSRDVFEHYHPVKAPTGVQMGDVSACYLVAYDVGGQLMYHSLYPFFCGPNMQSGIVFKLPDAVYGETATKTIADIRKYAHTARQFGGPGSKLYLIGTHADGISTSSVPCRLDAADSVWKKVVDCQQGFFRDFFEKVSVPDDIPLPASSPTEASVVPVCNQNANGEKDPMAGSLWRTVVSSIVENSDTKLEELVPKGWFRFEQYLGRIHGRVCMRVSELVSEAMMKKYHIVSKPSGVDADENSDSPDASEYSRETSVCAMLHALSSVGALILTEPVPDIMLESKQTDIPESFRRSWCIVSPMTVVKVARRLLPFPNETLESFRQRICLFGRSDRYGAPGVLLGPYVEPLYMQGLVSMELLQCTFRESMSNGSENEEAPPIVGVLEDRLFLCPIRIPGESPSWFVPSVVMHHVENGNRESGVYESGFESDGCVGVQVQLQWVPPGFALLFIGAMCLDLVECPTSTAYEDGTIVVQANVQCIGTDVYIEHTVGSGNITVWSEFSPQYSIEIWKRLLECVSASVVAAANRLKMEVNCTAKQAYALENSLAVQFAYPLLRDDGGAAHAVQWVSEKELHKGRMEGTRMWIPKTREFLVDKVRIFDRALVGQNWSLDKERLSKEHSSLDSLHELPGDCRVNELNPRQQLQLIDAILDYKQPEFERACANLDITYNRHINAHVTSGSPLHAYASRLVTHCGNINKTVREVLDALKAAGTGT